MWKKILSWLMLALVVATLVSLFLMKDRLNMYLSQSIKSQVSVQNKISIVSKIDSLYNYNENGQNFDYTFLEIGATGCITCKRMEIVLDEIRDKYPTKVNVVFINILIAKNQEIMKYYGVASIPTQILLDKSGKEFFRNSGYFSTLELSKHFNR